MELFVGNISADTREHEIRKFFGPYAKNATITLHKLKLAYSTYFYARVDIESERLAFKAIKKLHRKKLNGKSVPVREYEYRASNNDRRALHWRDMFWNQAERRCDERRQRAKLFKHSEPLFTGYDQLAKKG